MLGCPARCRKRVLFGGCKNTDLASTWEAEDLWFAKGAPDQPELQKETLTQNKQTNEQKEGVNKGDRAELESAKEASGSRTRSHYD